MASWDQLHATVEEAVDQMYGEQIQLRPFYSGGYTSGATVDPTRNVIDGVGYVLGKQAMLRADNALIAKRLEADLLLKVQDKYLTNIRANDRVALLAAKRGGQVCEIAYIEPSANARSVLHLMTVST